MDIFPIILFLTAASAPAQQPNVVLIYGDDVGYGDVGVNGSELIPTPNIDRLAAEGLRFTDGHCSASTCTPSRFSLLTGIHGFRHGIRVLRPDAPLTIMPHMYTLPKMFQAAGYATGIVGKWHLGLGDKGTPMDWNGKVAPGPLEVGFGYSFLLPSTNDRVPCVYVENHTVVNLDPEDPLYVGKKPDGFTGTVYPNGKKTPEAMSYYGITHGHNNSVINGIGRIGFQWGGKAALWNDETMADEFVTQTEAFLKRQTKDQPFFLFFSSQDIHVPRAPHPRYRGKSSLSFRGDAMVQLDAAVGSILEALEAEGLAENTIVIFTSDNGPVYDDGYQDGTTVPTSTKEVDRGHDASGIYRGGKYQIYEGGTRVPLILRWPAKVKPGSSAAMINQIDFLASFAALVNIELDETQGIDSRNVMPALLGKDPVGTTILIEESRGQALRDHQWKFIPPRGKNGKPQLYDLRVDPGEQTNLAAKNPERAAKMATHLQRLVNAEGGVRGAR